jgi:3-methyladenine DNA glycosylase AlkD
MMKHSVPVIVKVLRSEGSPRNVEGMARFGISSARAFGVSAPVIHSIAKEIGKDHDLALKLWSTGILEARLIAGLVGEPSLVTKKLMNSWVRDFDNWAVCDGSCGNLFDKTPFAYEMAFLWAKRRQEFVKRAGFVLMASLAVHDKEAPNERFLKFLPVIKKEADDQRNFVRKGVNWALRQIGKRNVKLNATAISVGKELRTRPSSAARWIASDALRELESAAVQKRLRKRERRLRNNRKQR